MMRVQVRPELLRWARERAGRSVESLRKRFPKVEAWERGEVMPTLKQLEAFARATYVPIGYLFLTKPPEERIPIPDLRTMGRRTLGPPSPDLLDILYLCQQRQIWYRDYARSTGEDQRLFVGSVKISASVEETAKEMRQALGFDIEGRRSCPTWTEALRRFIGEAERLGVLVMVSGVVGSNNRRKLNPAEFRGFALSDVFAPLVFINGADTKAAQVFTLAHELAHIWLGQSALSDAGAFAVPDHAIERWCNRVAAELLVPLDLVLETFRAEAQLEDEITRLARFFKVSTLVILRRIYDAGGITHDTFRKAYKDELDRLLVLPRGKRGDFYLTKGAHLGKIFARAVIVSTLEGWNSFSDAFRLLGIKKMTTFHDLGHRLGVNI